MFKIVVDLVVIAAVLSVIIYILSYKLWFGIGKKANNVAEDMKKGTANRED
jgi:hypothetical protein